VTAGSAQLTAHVDPDGSATRYYFRYGTVPCTKNPGTCTDLPVQPPEQIAGECPRAEESACFFEADVSVQAANLSPATTYHFGIVATNAAGTFETGESAEGTFTTPPIAGQALADGRALERVSPSDLNGGQAEPESVVSEGANLIQASASGGALTYLASAPLAGAEGSRSLEPAQLISTRGNGGWSSQDIATPNTRGTGLELLKEEYQFFSPTLALSLVQPFVAKEQGTLAEPPLSPPLSEGERGHQEKTIYLRDDAPIVPEGVEQAGYQAAQANGEAMANPGFLALVTAADVPLKAPFGEELRFLDASPDLSHVVFESQVALTEGSAAGKNLYEWSLPQGNTCSGSAPCAGSLTLISVLAGEEHAADEPDLGDGDTLLRHAISDDGSRIFWSDERHLYMRDTSAGKTIRIDGAGTERGAATFQIASADGSRVFFTDEQPLIEGSGATTNRPDLYVCEMVGDGSCKLTDVTPEHADERADVQGLVLGASEEGTTVYFVADGVLSNGAATEGATPGQCSNQELEHQPASAQCNLYVEHYNGQTESWEEPRFISRLSSEDAPDWTPVGKKSTPDEPELGRVTSRVSPDGQYLAFMSDEPLTGYDNRDASPNADGARDEEVYLFDADASAKRLICASCDPSGARPNGVFDPPEAERSNPEGWGLVVDRRGIWQGRWLAGSVPGWTKMNEEVSLYQSRYLSNSGRLYFDSPADLVPQATNHKEDVYEYEPLGVPRGAHTCDGSSATFVPSVGGCLGLISSGTSERESAFLDASESGGEGLSGEELTEGGGEVFFASAGLSSQEAGAGFAVFDAHECTGQRPCPATPPLVTPSACESSQSCRPASYTPSASVTPASAGVAGSGNVNPAGVVPRGKAKPKAKSMTRAQKLASALKACQKLKRRSRRLACQVQAHRKYGPVKKARSRGLSRRSVQPRVRR
jgi:hypothetical protein